MTHLKLSPIDRANLHAVLDKWIDDVAARPLSLDDGEYHHIEMTASRISIDDDDNLVMAFTVKTATEVQL